MKKGLLLPLISTIFLTSCSSDPFIETVIPDEVKNLGAAKVEILNLNETSDFSYDNINKNRDYLNLKETGNDILVIPQFYNDTKAITSFNSTVRGAFFHNDENFLDCTTYFNEISDGKIKLNFEIANSNNDFQIYPKINGQSFAAMDVAKDLMNKNLLGLIKPVFSYLAVQNYLELNDNDATKLSKFDSNSDGYLDSVFVMPFINFFSKTNLEVNETIFKEFESETLNYINPKEIKAQVESYLGTTFDFTISNYSFTSYFYLTETNDYYKSNGLECNNHQFIYEISRLFGLENLYSKLKDVANPLGYSSMFSGMIGSWDPFSLLVKNIFNAQVIKSEGYVTFDPTNEETKKTIYLIPVRDQINSYYDKYFLLMYYDCEGVYNKRDTLRNEYTLPSRNGFLLYQVDASLKYVDQNNVMYEVDTTKDTYISEIDYSLARNQSSSTYPFMKLLEANDNNSIADEGLIKNNDLFIPRTAFYADTYKDLTFIDGTTPKYRVYFDNIGESYKIYFSDVD